MLILRRFYARRYGARRIVNDPGISRRRALLERNEQETIEEEEFDDIETDFMSVSKSHREHIREMEMRQEKERYLIVKQKYFKDKFPNFLTWQDKEHIRYLHKTNPTEWTPEALSDAFPALPDIIKKIIKGKWTKENPSTHDKTVLKNWDDFKRGELNDIPEELKRHLNQFTNRTLNIDHVKPSSNRMVVKNQNRKHGQFSEIIESYERLKASKTNTDEPPKRAHTAEVRSRSSKSSSKPVTLKQLQHDVIEKIAEENAYQISPQDKMLAETQLYARDEKPKLIEFNEKEISDIMKNRHEVTVSRNAVVDISSKKDYSHLQYPELIKIPKNLFKRGCTYKMNDCYYDSDGEFLYRVPGMTN